MSAPESPMLALTGVRKRFSSGPVVLDDIDLSIARGEIVCLLGPSGCGKTTLLRIIAGLETADRGQIVCDGENLAGVPVHRRNFGLMFQEFALFPHRTVGQNIVFGLRMAGWSRAAMEERLAEMLALIGLPPAYAARTIFDLSGGERQRVALARSLAPNPRLLMLDEPLGNLDRALRESLMLELRRIIKRVGVTAVYVTHDQEEAYAVADRIVLMNQGRIVQMGPPQEVYTAPATPFAARFLGFENLLAVVAGEDGRSLTTPLGTPAPVPHTDTLEPGAQGTLLIHPQAAELHAEPAPGALSAEVIESSFRGDHVQVTLALPRSSPGTETRAGTTAGELGLSDTSVVLLHFDLPTYAYLDVVRAAAHDFTSGARIYVTIDWSMTRVFVGGGRVRNED